MMKNGDNINFYHCVQIYKINKLSLKSENLCVKYKIHQVNIKQQKKKKDIRFLSN